MSDDCVVYLLKGGRKDYDILTRRDPVRAEIIDSLVEQVEENGWILSVKAGLVKVLRTETCVGELRDVGRGGYRLFAFWRDTDAGREIWVCRILPKSSVVGRRRLNSVCDAVEELRIRFLREVADD